MGTQLAPEKKAHPPHPIFGPCLLWPNGLMDEDATWYESRPRPRPHCIRRGPSSPRKGHSSPPPLFGPCLLWPRSPISATAELLLLIRQTSLSPVLHGFFNFIPVSRQGGRPLSREYATAVNDQIHYSRDRVEAPYDGRNWADPRHWIVRRLSVGSGRCVRRHLSTCDTN